MSILVEDLMSTVAWQCFFIHHRLIIRLGIPAAKFEAIRPRIPYVGIRVRLRINPSANVMIASFRLMFVFPWLFMRFPVLRYPSAVYRSVSYTHLTLPTTPYV